MSVYKAQRNPSKAEFLTTAKKLFVFTIKLSKKFPKSYKFNMYQDLYNLTRDISLSVFQANSYYVNKTMSQEEYEKRLSHLYIARSKIYALTFMVSTVYEYIREGNNFLGTKEQANNIFQDWVDLITTERKLISGVIQDTKKRYKKYQNELKE